MMIKHFIAPVFAGFLLFSAGGAFAQSVVPEPTVTEEQGQGEPAAADGGFDWGWLGLIGLAGLAGLAGRRSR